MLLAMKKGQEESPADSFEIDPDEPVYVIGVVCGLTELPIWTLRILDREGIVEARRREGRARLYSLNDVKRLVRIRELMIEEGVNIQGIRVILERFESYLEEE